MARAYNRGKTLEKTSPFFNGSTARRDEGISRLTAQARRRILLVDDEAILAQSLNAALDRLGYEVTWFTNSLEALEVFQRQPDQYDLLLTDQKMPDLYGDELAEEVLRIRPEIPVLLCTGFTDSLTDLEAKAKGIREFLMKPFSLEVLAETIRRVLTRNTSPESVGQASETSEGLETM